VTLVGSSSTSRKRRRGRIAWRNALPIRRRILTLPSPETARRQLYRNMLACRSTCSHLETAGETTSRSRRERDEAERKKAAVASALTTLDEHYGVPHAVGSVDTDYSRSLLLGAVDMNGKRYARLESSLGRVVCVPWIDAFAELVGHEVSVYWGDRAKDDRVFHVTDADGNVDEEE